MRRPPLRQRGGFRHAPEWLFLVAMFSALAIGACLSMQYVAPTGGPWVAALTTLAAPFVLGGLFALVAVILIRAERRKNARPVTAAPPEPPTQGPPRREEP